MRVRVWQENVPEQSRQAASTFSQSLLFKRKCGHAFLALWLFLVLLGYLRLTDKRLERRRNDLLNPNSKYHFRKTRTKARSYVSSSFVEFFRARVPRFVFPYAHTRRPLFPIIFSYATLCTASRETRDPRQWLLSITRTFFAEDSTTDGCFTIHCYPSGEKARTNYRRTKPVQMNRWTYNPARNAIDARPCAWLYLSHDICCLTRCFIHHLTLKGHLFNAIILFLLVKETRR